MKHALKLKNNTRKSSASVVDGKLILSFPEAKTPVVWQMDFSEVKASALEVKTSKDKKTHTLTLRTMKGETVDVAPFAQREQAVEGLMAAANALENAHGQIRPAASVSNIAGGHAKGKKGGKWFGTALIIVLFFILVGIWGSLTPRDPSSLNYVDSNTLNSSAQSAFSGTSNSASGVPLSADEFLRDR